MLEERFRAQTGEVHQTGDVRVRDHGGEQRVLLSGRRVDAVDLGRRFRLVADLKSEETLTAHAQRDDLLGRFGDGEPALVLSGLQVELENRVGPLALLVVPARGHVQRAPADGERPAGESRCVTSDSWS